MTTTSHDYKSLYQQKCRQYQDLQLQFNQIQQQSNLIMNDLQDQIKQTKRKNQQQQRQIKQLKQKRKYITSTIQRQLDQAQKQKNQFKIKFKDFQKKVIQLEIINQDLQNQLRATRSTLEQYQISTQKTMEQLAILRVQLEQSTSSNQQQIARLKQQLGQTQDQIIVMHKKMKKKSEQDVFSEAGSQARKRFQNYRAKQTITQQPGSTITNPVQNLIIKTPLKLNKQDNYQKPFTPQQSYRPSVQSSSFREALKQIRSYIQSIDMRKQQTRRVLLNYKSNK